MLVFQGGNSMAYVRIAWDRALETGYAVVDNQHKQWIASVNAFFEAYQRGKGSKEVERTLAFLVSYALKHLDDEEELQKKYSYPGHLEHKQVHAVFKELAHNLVATMRCNGPTDEVINYVCVTISQWLINHIKQNDLKMAAYIRNEEQQRISQKKGWTRLYDGKN